MGLALNLPVPFPRVEYDKLRDEMGIYAGAYSLTEDPVVFDHLFCFSIIVIVCNEC